MTTNSNVGDFPRIPARGRFPDIERDERERFFSGEIGTHGTVKFPNFLLNRPITRTTSMLRILLPLPTQNSVLCKKLTVS